MSEKSSAIVIGILNRANYTLRCIFSMSGTTVRFLSNDELITLENVEPNKTVLEYLREDLYKTGTKEGCASGDCGACTVVVAEQDPENNNELKYKAINSCISFVGSLHGKQLITVEDLKQGNELHPVQQSLVDNHGTQCGFCTPGFVMSAFALHKDIPTPNREEVVEALAGNLCRCTGYRSIIDAAMESSEGKRDSFDANASVIAEQLSEINKQDDSAIEHCGKSYYSPTNVEQLASHLIKHPDATLVAGATDLALMVTQMQKSFEKLVDLTKVKELLSVNGEGENINIGAAVPYSTFTPLLAEQYHDLGEMIERIGSTQIRNNGTLGGNIGNASPIGDMPPALIALDATMVLQKGDATRKIKVEDYFVDYKKTVLEPSEFIRSISVPKAKENQIVKLYKISKRIDDDISAVLAAISIELDGNQVKDCRIAFGGMAATPKRATQCEQALLGQAFEQESIDAAKQALTKDFSPMSDVRASDQYRMRVAQNLIQKCFIEIQQRNIETRVVSYA